MLQLRLLSISCTTGTGININLWWGSSSYFGGLMALFALARQNRPEQPIARGGLARVPGLRPLDVDSSKSDHEQTHRPGSPASPSPDADPVRRGHPAVRRPEINYGTMPDGTVIEQYTDQRQQHHHPAPS